MQDVRSGSWAARVFGCLLLGSVIAVSGCSALIEKKSRQLGDGFTAAVLDSDDPVTIEQALPSYLLLLDALVRNNPDISTLTTAAASLNSAYASSFVKDPVRIKALNDKALRYAFSALCQSDARLCQPRQLAMDDLEALLRQKDRPQAEVLYVAGTVWAGWIQANSEDWNAVADLPRVEAMLKRVEALDDGYQHGAVHLYLGVLATVRTPALGGQPEVGKQHFERAIALSNGRNLMAKLYYAKNYARGVFDRELHDRLLQEVLAADPHAEGFTLGNLLAQQQARELLQSADDYF